MAPKKTADKFKEIATKELEPGMVIRIHQMIKDVSSKGEEKERIQVFEGLVTKRRGGNNAGATFTVRKVAEGVGVERIFPLTLPSIKKVQLVKRYKVRRANISFVRESKKHMKEMTIA